MNIVRDIQCRKLYITTDKGRICNIYTVTNGYRLSNHSKNQMRERSQNYTLLFTHLCQRLQRLMIIVVGDWECNRNFRGSKNIENHKTSRIRRND